MDTERPSSQLWTGVVLMVIQVVAVAGLRWLADHDPAWKAVEWPVALSGVLICPFVLGTTLLTLGEGTWVFRCALATWLMVIAGLVVPPATPDLWGIRVLVTGLAVVGGLATLVAMIDTARRSR